MISLNLMISSDITRQPWQASTGSSAFQKIAVPGKCRGRPEIFSRLSRQRHGIVRSQEWDMISRSAFRFLGMFSRQSTRIILHHQGSMKSHLDFWATSLGLLGPESKPLDGDKRRIYDYWFHAVSIGKLRVRVPRRGFTVAMIGTRL